MENNNLMMNIMIWGTGKIACELLENGVNANLIGFVQSKKNIDTFRKLPVYSPDNLPTGYNLIIVANSYSDEIYDTCIKNGISENKLVFLIRGLKTSFNTHRKVIDILSEKDYTNYLIQYGRIEGSFFERDKELYTKLNNRKNFEIKYEYLWPILYEKFALNGDMGNYFWQDLWAAKKIIKKGVKEHYDIGSRIDGFIAHLVAAGISVNLIDVRPIHSEIEGVQAIIDDATELQQFEDESIDSISALCSLEHFGLGRYGDPVDPEACFRCFDNIQKKVKTGGDIYISVPVGSERVEFNAHRVFYANTIITSFRETQLLEYSCAAEGTIEYNVDIHKYDNDDHNGNYRYGLFHFQKK